SLGELFTIALACLQALHNSIQGLCHLQRILDRTLGLSFQVRSAAVPKQRAIVRTIDHARSPASSRLALHSGGYRLIVCKSQGGFVALRTCYRRVDRERGIVEQAPAQRDSLGSWGIVGWNGNGRQAKRRLDCDTPPDGAHRRRFLVFRSPGDSSMDEHE